METPNYYEEREKKNFSSQKPENENNLSQPGKKVNWADILKNVGIDAGIGVLGGGTGAALLGQLSLPLGALINGYGHYSKNDKIRILGLGLMASSSMTHYTKQDPKASLTDNMKERLKGFGCELKSKLFLDKLMPENPVKKAETKKSDDLKGTEQKKIKTDTTQTSQKAEETKTANHETDYLNPENTTEPLSNSGNEPIERKPGRFDDEDLSDIAEKLY